MSKQIRSPINQDPVSEKLLIKFGDGNRNNGKPREMKRGAGEEGNHGTKHVLKE